MGCQQTRELTVIGVSRGVDGDRYYIYFNGEDPLRLFIDDPNFQKMFDFITIGGTYKFTYKTINSEIISVASAQSHYTCGEITHIIDMEKTLSTLKGYFEIKVNDFDKTKILMIDTDQKNTINIGKTYGIHYLEWYGRDNYKVTELEPCGLVTAESHLVVNQ